MIVIKFAGGLGNQMFQYAFYKKMESLGKKPLADLSFYNEEENKERPFLLESVFKIKLKRAKEKDIKKLRDNRLFFRRIRKFFNILWKKTDVWQKNFNFNRKYFLLKEGYWQSEKFFEGVEKELMKDFEFRKIDQKNNSILKKLEKKNQNLVSLHIRRGDYYSDKDSNKLLGNIANKEYYLKAIKIMQERIKNPFFVIFSDNIEYTKKEFNFLKSKKFISINSGEKAYQDIFLMSNCHYNIIANSSFSWWGAYLNKNPKKIIICPKKWFNKRRLDSKDIVPDNWTRI